MFGLNVWVIVRGGRARLPRLGVRWQRYSPLCGVASGDVWHQMMRSDATSGDTEPRSGTAPAQGGSWHPAACTEGPRI